MVKQSKPPRYADFFTTAESAFTGWLANHPRSLLTGEQTRAAGDEGDFVLAGGDESSGRRGKGQPLPDARCEALGDSLQAARTEAAQADVMRQNWQLEAASRARDLDRINAQLDAIFARLQEIDREHAERLTGVEANPDADPKKPPQSWLRDKSWTKGTAKSTGWATLLSMLEETVSRAQAEGRKSAHAERTRELIELRRIAEADWARAEARRREEEAKLRAARERIDAIKRQMISHGCSIPPSAHG
jgi:hypothetical protein